MSDFDEVPQPPRTRRTVSAAAVAAAAAVQQAGVEAQSSAPASPAPAGEAAPAPRVDTRRPRRERFQRSQGAAVQAAPAAPSPLAVLTAETVPPPTRAATPVAGSPAAPARSDTLNGLGPEAQPPAPRPPPPAVKPWWVSKHPNGVDSEGPLDPEAFKARVRAGVVGFGHFIWHATETKGEWIPFASGATSWLRAFVPPPSTVVGSSGQAPPPPPPPPPPAGVVVGFRPIAPAAAPTSPVVGWSGQAPPVATPPPPLPQPAGQVTPVQDGQPADPAQRRFCAHCGYDFVVKNERVCPRCQTVRGEAKPPQQSSNAPVATSPAVVVAQPVPQAVAPAAHAAYVPPGMPTAMSIGNNFCDQCGHTRQHGAGLKCCEQCGHNFPN